jgi:Cu(I)/Ag(I) efflux system membrane fusion protein
MKRSKKLFRLIPVAVFILLLLVGSWYLFAKKIPAPSLPRAQTHDNHDGPGQIVAEAEVPESPPEAISPEDEQETPRVEISPEWQQLVGVKTVQVSVSPLRKTIRTVGKIEYDEKKLATVNTKIEGWIEKLYVDYTGRYVKKGEPLADIYSPELYATQQEYLNIVKWAKRKPEGKPQVDPEDRSGDMPGDKTGNEPGNKKDTIGRMLAKDIDDILESGRQRLRLWDISAEQIRRIEETGKPVRTLTLHSPVSGYVVQKNALRGMKVMPGEKLFDVADLSTVWIVADVYEYELPLIRTGQQARISLSYFPGREFSSRIDYVFPTLSPETRTARVRFILPNPRLQLKPQMFTNVEIKIDLGRRLSVPASAVMDTGRGHVSYVDKGEGYFEPREVTVGVRADEAVEILRGLEAGERVASSANFLIDSEAQLKGIKPLPHKH